MRAKRIGALLGAAAGLLAAAELAASDTLYTVAFEHATAVEQLAIVDPVTGSLTDIGAGIAGCCLIPSGVSTFDPAADVFYFVGGYQADPPGTQRIFALDAATGAVLSQPVLAAGFNYNFLEFDPGTGTLYGIVHDLGATSELLVEIDPVTGGVTPIGAGAAACCGVPSGVSALDSAGGLAYFVGKFFSDPPDDFRIFALDLATGAVLSSPFLPSGFNHNFLGFDRSPGTLYAVVFEIATTTERLVEVNPATGALTPVGAGVAGCCLISSGVSAVDPNGDVFYFAGVFQAEDSSLRRIFGLDLATGAVLGNPFLPAGHNYNFLEFDPSDEPEPPVVVAIDVKPGTFPNSVNPGSNGVIPVAVLTDAGFDALTVDVATVRFSGPAGAPEAHGKGHPADVDGDGDLDLLLHFRTQLTGIQCGDTTATLVGATLGGDPFTGSDSIVTVGCP
ncbi:MAG: DUF6923 family protein [Thermoanaerobaculia bacterium]